MKEQFLMLQKEFEKIKEKGYIKGIYNNLSSSGRTLENELDLPRNKESMPDYYGIELKTHRTYSKSHINLFNAVPNGKYQNELKRIKDLYGYPSSKDKKYKVLYAEIYADKMTFAGAKFQYKLEVSKKEKKIYLCIYGKNGKLIDREVYWTFEYIKEKLENKLKYLAIIDVWPKTINGWNYFNYYKITFYYLKRFNKFIELIENGQIRLVIKIGIYLDEANYGKMYDHGCGFSIAPTNIRKLFYKYLLDGNRLV